jgi:hypothetical protein
MYFPIDASKPKPAWIDGINDVLTSAMSRVLFKDPCLGNEAFECIQRIQHAHHSDDDVFMFFKGGLALHVLTEAKVKKLKSSPDVNQRDLKKFLRLGEKYMALSDCDTSCLIRADTLATFERKKQEFVRMAVKEIKKSRAILRKRLDNPDVLSIIEKSVNDNSRSILALLDKKLIKWDPAQVYIQVTPAARADFVVDLVEEEHVCKHHGVKKSPCARMQLVRDTPPTTMFVSINNNVSFETNTGSVTSFALIRLKFNFEIRIEHRITGEIVKLPHKYAAEVFDLSIPNFKDHNRIKFFDRNYQDHISMKKITICNQDHRVPVATLKYAELDLESILYYLQSSKTPKRQIRWVLIQKMLGKTKPLPKIIADTFNAAYNTYGSLNNRSFIPLTFYDSGFIADMHEAMNLQLYNNKVNSKNTNNDNNNNSNRIKSFKPWKNNAQVQSDIRQRGKGARA